MTAYDVTVSGCDASTLAFGVELSAEEHGTLGRVVAAVNAASHSGCAPTMSVALTPAPPESATCGECFEQATAADGLARNRYAEWCHARCLGGSS